MILRDRLLRDGAIRQAAAMVVVDFAPSAWIAGPGGISMVSTLAVYSQRALLNRVRAPRIR